jgi:hypothetical protein
MPAATICWLLLVAAHAAGAAVVLPSTPGTHDMCASLGMGEAWVQTAALKIRQKSFEVCGCSLPLHLTFNTLGTSSCLLLMIGRS